MALLGILATELSVVEVAQMVWNAALAANPIGAVIVASAAFIAVVAGVRVALSKLDKDHEKLNESQEKMVKSTEEKLTKVKESIDSYKSENDAIKSTTKANKELAEKIQELSSKENKSAEDKAKLQSYIESLNGSINGVNLSHDDEKIALNMGNDALNERVAAYGKVQQAQLAEENRVPLLEQEEQAEKALTEAVKQREFIEKQMNENRNIGAAQMSEYNKKRDEAKIKEEEARAAKERLAGMQTQLDNTVISGQQAQANAVNAGAESQKITLESLNETQQEVVSSMNETWQEVHIEKYIDN